MSSPPRLLNADILGQFEALLRTKRIGIVDAWAPGLTDAQIDEITGPTDLQLPEEARAWWRWHNGTTSGHDAWDEFIAPGRDLWPLEIAVRDYDYIGRRDQLLQPVGDKPYIYVACRQAGDVPAPIYYDRYDDFQPDIALPSFGELVLTWIKYIETGIYATNPSGGWAPRPLAPPGDVLDRGVL